MMFIVIIIGIAFVLGCFSVAGTTKKGAEIISVLGRILVCGFFSMVIYQKLGIVFESGWMQMLFMIVGALVIWLLMMLLAACFRLVGYSINYFLNSCLLLVIGMVLKEKISITFVTYAITLFLFPRIMWINDRLATFEEHTHTDDYGDLIINHYISWDIDLWEDFRNSWRYVPVQIVIAAIIYIAGSLTIFGVCSVAIFGVCSVDSSWLQLLFAVLAATFNIIFDLFVFRKIEEHFFPT